MVATLRTALVLGTVAAVAIGCHEAREPASDVEPDRLAELRGFEESELAKRDFARGETFERGPDPSAIEALPERRFAGVLRGSSELVLLDSDLRELDRVASPRSTVALDVDEATAFTGGELSNEIGVFEARGSRWTKLAPVIVPGVLGIRALAHDERRLYVADEHGGRLITIDRNNPSEQRSIAFGARPIAVASRGPFVLVSSLLDHTVSIVELDGDGWPQPPRARIRHDGPIWSFDAALEAGSLLIAAGGVEDHPLDRTIGSFGFIDSYVFVYRWSPGSRPERIAALNVSEHRVVTPKVVRLRRTEPLALEVWGYGGDHRALVEWPGGAPPRVSTFAVPPGVTAVATAPGGEVVAANPLLDVWMSLDPRAPRRVLIRHSRDPSRESRLGEALFYTYLMAPSNRSDGALSRFTCETCHFEGSVDGRVHHSGRGDVRVTTKPLLGLFGNRPYFTRALDPDLTKMVDNEFRVAGAGSGTDPWFEIHPRDHAWLDALGVTDTVSPIELRRALMRYLMDAGHRPNPAALGRTRFDARERRGAEVFRDRCSGCHAPRLRADTPGSEVPFDGWEAALLSRSSTIVWAKDRYEKTGITPYVHERGARVPSLRRLYLKRPYFTNGSAASLDDVLARARFDSDVFLHAGGGPELSALSATERENLRAFLELL